jgi:hypothetical protein
MSGLTVQMMCKFFMAYANTPLIAALLISIILTANRSSSENDSAESSARYCLLRQIDPFMYRKQ